jgi:hypothetical protein
VKCPCASPWVTATKRSPMELPNVQSVTPERLTEDEALRAGIEHGRYLSIGACPMRHNGEQER